MLLLAGLLFGKCFFWSPVSVLGFFFGWCVGFVLYRMQSMSGVLRMGFVFSGMQSVFEVSLRGCKSGFGDFVFGVCVCRVGCALGCTYVSVCCGVVIFGWENR